MAVMPPIRFYKISVVITSGFVRSSSALILNTINHSACGGKQPKD